MEEKLEEKKEWITPEIIDLDVKNTGKDYHVNETDFGFGISTTAGPS